MEDSPRARRRPAVAAGVSWAILMAALICAGLLDVRLRAVGRGDLVEFLSVGGAVFIVGILSAAIVGAALMTRRPRHPVGWLFLGLALAVAVLGAADEYAAYGAVARPGALPGARLVGMLGQGAKAPWLVLITLILLLTPTGRPPSPRWRPLQWASVIGGGVWFVMIMLSSRALQAPMEGLKSPLAWAAGAPVIAVVRRLAAIVTNGAAVMAASSLVVRSRSATDNERLQLRWMALAALPLATLIAGAFVAAVTHHPSVPPFLAGGFVALLPVAAGLSVMQYRLYDIDRLLSRALTYLLLSGIVVGCYVGVVVVLGRILSTVSGHSQIAAVVGTLAAVSLARPARADLQQALDRRYNRRQFDAVRTIQRYVREPPTDVTIAEAMRLALDDPSVDVAYWIAERGCWVSEDGNPACATGAGIDVRRRGESVASVVFDAVRGDIRIVQAVVTEARPELENARLRAAVALQLVEVRASRSRIVAAQLAERQKIERNLHDGAQQRLLALGLQLRAAEVSLDPQRPRLALAGAVEAIQAAVAELRDLANGLHPSVLSDGGLAAAFDDLAARTPMQMNLRVIEDRFAPEVEAAAWFITCEAVANTVKHAEASIVEIDCSRRNGHLLLAITDDGVGGADPSGRGLRGIADRAEAIGGRLRVASEAGTGTTVTAELRCES